MRRSVVKLTVNCNVRWDALELLMLMIIGCPFPVVVSLLLLRRTGTLGVSERVTLLRMSPLLPLVTSIIAIGIPVDLVREDDSDFMNYSAM